MKNISRDSSLTNSFTHTFKPFLSRGACLFSILFLPAMFFSCIQTESLHEEVPNIVGIMKASSNMDMEIATLDAFIFNPDGRLDCYQQHEYPDENIETASGSGQKTILLVANSNKDRYEWTDIRTLSSINGIFFDLEKERPGRPVMATIKSITAGESVTLDMQPLRSEIHLSSIRCDFSDKSYKGMKLTDVRIYLTYANATCSIIPKHPVQASRLINVGMLDECHLEHFEEKDMIVQEIATDIGSEKVPVGRSLFCYANEPEEETIGTPFTRLVIEGRIGGNIYYYPIRINPQGGGIVNGCRYVFDIVLTRAGATDPDGNLEEEDIEIKMEIEKWSEKEWYEVKF